MEDQKKEPKVQDKKPAQNNTNEPAPAPESAPAQPENANREYGEYKISVEIKMKKLKGGGEELDHYIGEVGKKVKTVRIEPKRAEQMNKQWENRKIIYLDIAKPIPDTIKRSYDDEGVAKDEPTYAA